MNTNGRILIVDDHKTNLMKIGMTVKSLGYDAVTVDSGSEALGLISAEQFDIILLDIVMPEMDGFEVLEQLKQNEDLQHIPVIVISALEDEKENVARAIELGAEDFLPKDFERVVFAARVNSALEKKRTRDANRQYLQEVGVLTHAAEVLENGPVNPERLGLDGVSSRDESLHRLANIFQDMAGQIYARERRLRQQVNTLKGILLLLACGGMFGLAVPLSKIAVEIEASPIGLAFWVNLFGLLFCVPFVLQKRNLPKLNWPLIKFFCIWGIVSAGAGEILIFWVAEVLPASIISIIIVTEGFIVFLMAALFRIEEPNLRRFFGVAIGLAGIVAIIIASEGLVGSSAWIWIMVALGIPLGYAIEDVIIAAKMPEDVDTLTAVAYVCLSASVMLLIAAILFDDFVMLSLNPGKLELSIALIGITGSVGTFLFVRLIETTGAVFASQCGYVMTFSGIAWSIILLGETLSVLTWAGLAVIVVGLIVVGPQEEPEPELELEAAGLPVK